LVAHRGTKALIGLHGAQSKSNAALDSMPNLVVLPY
jgi:hypothetical protein